MAKGKANDIRNTSIRGGRLEQPDIERRIEIACKRLGDGAIRLLEKLMMDENTEVRWRIVAAKEILDRGFGRPKQSIDQKITMNGGEAFLEIMRDARERAEKEVQPTTVEGIVH